MALVAAGELQAEVSSWCFSPRGRCHETVVEQIGHAQGTLRVAIYSLTHPEIVDALLAAHGRGVEVWVIVDRVQAKGRASLVGRLKEAGIPVRQNRHRGLMHHKFLVVDDQNLLTGSFNFSVGAATRNDENLVVLAEEPEVIQAYTEYFDQLWENRRRIGRIE